MNRDLKKLYDSFNPQVGDELRGIISAPVAFFKKILWLEASLKRTGAGVQYAQRNGAKRV